MRKVLLISLLSVLLLITGCLYSPATYQPTEEEQNLLNLFADDSTFIKKEISGVVLELINNNWKDSYLDTVKVYDTLSVVEVYDTLATDTTIIDTSLVYDIATLGFLGLEISNGKTVGDSLSKIVISPINAYKIYVSSSYLSAFTKLEILIPGTYNFWMDIHGTIAIWDANSDIVEYDTYGMSTACAMVFKGDTRNSLIREHYTYSLDAGTYYIRFKKAENAAYKSKNYFFGIVN
ncbi:MAG: hypothetical protein KAT14_01410 [Candidatus Marinimicrobia bacterium]|nr:hypothetical protein [Candidatus Neomarinimicrobiota bacterium]